MSGGYIVLLGNVSPHVVAAVFNVETPVNCAEQGQTQVCANVIVNQRVVLHHIVAKHPSPLPLTAWW